MPLRNDREGSGAVARFLAKVMSGEAAHPQEREVVSACLRADLVTRNGNEKLALTDAGQAWLARYEHGRSGDPAIGGFRAQHLHLSRTAISRDGVPEEVVVDDGESPLAWLARRKGRDGRAMIDSTQFAAGERLRIDFTRAQMMPRVTSNWAAPTGRSGTGGAGEITDVIVAARQRVSRALDAVGPEFSGILLDVCCFLHGLEQVERARAWPARSAKVVLQLGLDRLARHYGLSGVAEGHADARLRRWISEPLPRA